MASDDAADAISRYSRQVADTIVRDVCALRQVLRIAPFHDLLSLLGSECAAVAIVLMS